MKRILPIGLVLVLPAALFAEAGVDGAALYNSPLLVGQEINAPGLNANKFSFGPDVRFKWSILQLEALGLFSYGDHSASAPASTPGWPSTSSSCVSPRGGGLSLNHNLEDKSLERGSNAQVNADVKLPRLAVGLTYLMDLTIDNGIDLAASSGLLRPRSRSGSSR